MAGGPDPIDRRSPLNCVNTLSLPPHPSSCAGRAGMRRPSAGHAPLLWLVLYLLFLHTPLASAKCELTTAGRCGQGGGGWWWGGPRTSLWEFLPPCLIDAGRSVAPRRGLAATHAPAARAGPCETAGPFDRPTAAADGRLPVVCRPLVGSPTGWFGCGGGSAVTCTLRPQLTSAVVETHG